jgi:hypothetical protein
MAAGQGFKTFTTGEVLTAGDVNGYLMQGINVFATTTARDAAITAPAEGQFAFTKDTNSLWYYDGAAWVASGATGDIEGVSVTSPITGGGTSGTVTVGIQDASTSQRGSVQLSDSVSTTDSTLAATSTAVKSANDLATAAIPKSTVTTNGDLIYGTGSSTVTRRGIGSTGQVLTVASGVPTWSTPSGGSLDYVLLNTGGTALSSTSTSVSFSAQKALFILIDTCSSSSATAFYVRFNNVTSSVVGLVYLKQTGAATPVMEKDILSSLLNLGKTDAAAHSVTSYINMSGTDKTGWKPGTWTVAPTAQSGASQAFTGNFVYRDTAAITSIQIFLDSGTFDSGTVYIYGAS